MAVNSRVQDRLRQPQRGPVRHLPAEARETLDQQPHDRRSAQQPRDIDPPDARERSAGGMRQVVTDPAHT
jgi:hypothetical protein